MKQLCTIALLFLLSSTVSGQFQKGDRFVNGYVGLSNERWEDSNGDLSTKYFSMSIGPAAGLFIRNNLAVGVGVGYGHSRTETLPSSYVNQSNSFGVNFTGRKYFSVGENLAITLTGYLGTNIYKHVNGTQESKGFGVGAYIQPGLVFLLNPNWSIDLNLGSVGYGFNRNTTNESNNNRISLNAGSLNLGWTYYLRGNN